LFKRKILLSCEKDFERRIILKIFIMKKILFFMIALLISGMVMAQASKETREMKSFLAFHAGPSFPVGDFKKGVLPTDGGFFGKGGFAKTGYNLNLNYGYKFGQNFGLAASAFYNNNTVSTKSFVSELNKLFNSEGGQTVDVTGVKLDHWQWYGVTVGPALMQNLASNIDLDLRVMGGIANVNSPKVTFEGATVFGEDWSPAAVFQAGANLRFGIGKNAFVFTNVDYTYMKPEFKKEFNLGGWVTDDIGIERGKQTMSTINLTGGIGFKF
jgi:hypothetical protein